jgi:hypothetical protein
VESTNYKERTHGTDFEATFHRWATTDALQVVERFTRGGPNTVRYEYTVTDPKTWARPWSVEAELPRVEPPVIYEFACHEQNYGLLNVVTGSQIDEGTRQPEWDTQAR